MANCGPIGRSRRAKWRALTLVAVHVVIAAHLAHWWLTGRTVTPVEPSEAMQTLELGWVNAGFVFFAASLLLTVIFGRFVCGWACHVVALQDLCAHLLQRVGLRPRPVRSRLLACVPLAAALYMFVWPTVWRWLRGGAAPPLESHFVTADFWATFPGPWMAIATLTVCGFLVVWWLGAKGFCTYGCPYGGFFAVLDRFAPGRIVVDDNCDGCAHCTAVCTSNVRVHQEVRDFKMVVDAGCMKCLDCVSVCPKGALAFGFRAPALAKSPTRSWDFLWREELGLALVFVLALLSLWGAYGVVPLLFSIGLSVLTASAALLVWRLWRRPQVAWQRLLLKQQGRLARSGRFFVGVALVWFLFVAHTGFVTYWQWRGHSLLNAAMQATTDDAREDARLASLQALQRAEAAALFADYRLHYDLAQHASVRGDLAEVETRLRRVVALAARDDVARVRLANVIYLRDPTRVAEAEALLREVLARHPDHPQASASLAAMEARRR
ncbi:MAG: 4Fe-4S binding protein [Planctomycetota bacterium]